eukprot:1809563-Ditylum_brightwellii.AAC.1
MVWNSVMLDFVKAGVYNGIRVDVVCGWMVWDGKDGDMKVCLTIILSHIDRSGGFKLGRSKVLAMIIEEMKVISIVVVKIEGRTSRDGMIKM